MSQQDGRPWESDGDLPWDTPDGDWEPAESEAWRGDIHLGDWPENLAGPEYWLYKKDQTDEKFGGEQPRKLRGIGEKNRSLSSLDRACSVYQPPLSPRSSS
jgi:hypothetical protein